MSKEVVIHGRAFESFLSEEAIRRRIGEMAAMIAADYAERLPLFLPILNGSFVFAADLLRAYPAECELAFVKLSSYRGMRSSGRVETLIGLDLDLSGKDIVIVEDIVDSGRTLSDFLPVLQTARPASVAIASLLVKPDALEFPLEIAYRGFEIPTRFVVGYGLDYDGLGRNLPEIYQLKER